LFVSPRRRRLKNGEIWAPSSHGKASHADNILGLLALRWPHARRLQIRNRNGLAIEMTRLLNKGYLLVVVALAACSTLIWVLCLDPAQFAKMMAQNGASFIDFLKVYSIAKMILAGQGQLIYDPQARSAFLVGEGFSNAAVDYFKFLPYPPFVYPLFIPFALLPRVIAYATWLLLSFAVAFFGLQSFRKQLGKSDSASELLLAFSLLVGSVFFFNNYLLGQSACMLVGLAAIFFVAFLRKNDTVCGIAVGLSTIKFQFLLLLGAPLLMHFRWRAMLVAALVESLFGASAFFSIGAHNLALYPQVLNVQEILHPNIPLMINVRGVLYSLLPNSDRLQETVSAVAAVVFNCLLWFSSKRPEQVKYAICLASLSYVILGPHVFVYDGLLLALPLFTILPEFSLSGVLKLADHRKRLQCILLLASPFLEWFGYWRSNELLARIVLIMNLALFCLIFVDWITTMSDSNSPDSQA
jgi:hypothetical protein